VPEERFKILFRGDLAEGIRRDEVRQKLIELFGLKAETVDALLGGQTATLKKNLDREGALKFKQAFERTGAICYIRPMDDSAATTAPHPPSAPLSQPVRPPASKPAPLRSDTESFTVVDTGAPVEADAPTTEPVFEIPAGPVPGTMTCPKCSFVQPKADFCEACGVVILKFLKRQWEEEQLVRQLEEAQQSPQEPPATDAPAAPSGEVRPTPSPTPRPLTSQAPRIEREEPDAFTVMDTPPPHAEGGMEPAPVFEIPEGPTPGMMTCPKCSFVQPKADFCEACGVVILKFLKRQWEEEQLARQLEATQNASADTAPEAEAPSDSASAPPRQPTLGGVPSRVAPEPPSPGSPLTAPSGPTPGTMTCPKCAYVQPSAGTCAACGVVILKYMQRMAAEHQQSAAPPQGGDEDGDQEGDLASPPQKEVSLAPPTASDLTNVPEEPFRHIYRRAWHRLRGSSTQLIPLWLATLLLVALALHERQALSVHLPPPFPALLTGLIALLLISLAINATLHLLTDAFLQLRPSLAIGLLRLGPFLWLHGWLLLVLLGGTLALVIPGYLFARWFCLAPLCFAVEQTQGLSCLLRSRAYALGREKLLGRMLLPTLPLPLVSLVGWILLPGMFKLLALLPLPVFLALLTVLYCDVAASRPQLSYDDRLTVRLQWPAFGVAGLLVFTILAVSIFGSGRIRSVLYTAALQTGLSTPPSVPAPGASRAAQTVADYTSGVVELQLSGYQAHVFLNGEEVMAAVEGGASHRSLSAPVFMKPGRNLLAVRYAVQEGADNPDMQLRVFRWNLAEMRDEDLGRWKIGDVRGLRRYEFNVKKPATAKRKP